MRIYNYIFFILSFFTLSAQATMTAQIYPTKATLDDTLRLTITVDNTHTQRTPDLTLLQKDFNIVGTQQSLSYSFINGQSEARAQWIIILSPKKIGNITIPAISLGTDKTQPLLVEIIPSTQVDNSVQNIELQTGVDNPRAFINQQIIYTVRLSPGVQLIDTNYQPPQVEDALLVPLNEPTTTNEQRYAIFPQKTGPIVIHPPQLSGMIYDGMPHRIFIQGKQITLDIQPKPKIVSHWLPAKQIELTESYTQSQPQMTEGDTITRQVILKSVGVPHELLPTLFFQSTAEATAYPEKPTGVNTVKNQNVVGKQTYTIAYVIHGSGHIQLPEIGVKWFNTKTKKPEISRLPAHNIFVQSKASLTKPTLTKNKPPKRTPLPLAVKSMQIWQPNQTNIAWWLCGGLALLWVITVFLLWHSLRNKPKKPKSKYDLPHINPQQGPQ